MSTYHETSHMISNHHDCKSRNRFAQSSIIHVVGFFRVNFVVNNAFEEEKEYSLPRAT